MIWVAGRCAMTVESSTMSSNQINTENSDWQANTVAGMAKGGRRGSYMVLCYARMRTRMKEGEWFTRTEYYDFQLQKIDRNKIKHYTNTLTKSGFLERHFNGIQWRITQDGFKLIRELDKRFTIMNPHGNSQTASAIHARNKVLKKEEESILNGSNNTVPFVTK